MAVDGPDRRRVGRHAGTPRPGCGAPERPEAPGGRKVRSGSRVTATGALPREHSHGPPVRPFSRRGSTAAADRQRARTFARRSGSRASNRDIERGWRLDRSLPKLPVRSRRERRTRARQRFLQPAVAISEPRPVHSSRNCSGHRPRRRLAGDLPIGRHANSFRRRAVRTGSLQVRLPTTAEVAG